MPTVITMSEALSLIKLLQERYIYLIQLRTNTARYHATFTGVVLAGLFWAIRTDAKVLSAEAMVVVAIMALTFSAMLGLAAFVYDYQITARAQKVADEMELVARAGNLLAEGEHRATRLTEDFWFFAQSVILDLFLIVTAAVLLCILVLNELKIQWQLLGWWNFAPMIVYFTLFYISRALWKAGAESYYKRAANWLPSSGLASCQPVGNNHGYEVHSDV